MHYVYGGNVKVKRHKKMLKGLTPGILDEDEGVTIKGYHNHNMIYKSALTFGF